MIMMYTCPVCGFLTFNRPPGSYEICNVCGWEDDGVLLANPCTGGGANRESLVEAQRGTLKEYPPFVKETDGFSRDLSWRPMTESEIEYFLKVSDGGTRWGQGCITYPKDYYWKRNSQSSGDG
jgi:hypothetical protein